MNAPLRLLIQLLSVMILSCSWTAAHAQADSARNSRHALIIGISDYISASVSPLAGVRHDMESARRMADSMGIPATNTVYLRNAEATADNIRKAITALAERVAPGDRVFIYFSGHGTRYYDPNANKENCTEGLFAADSKVVTNLEMARLLGRLSAKTDKLIVFYDACFSGGVASTALQTRSVTPGAGLITPRFAPGESAEQCSKPSNVVSRSLNLVMQQGGTLPENIVHIAASRQDEVSFDNSARGGYATVAFRDCLLGEAKDLDGSGAVTVEEVRQCAQQKLDTAFTSNPEIKGQHMQIGGNKAFVPSAMAAGFAPPAVASSSSAASSATVVRPAQPADVLSEIFAQRDAARILKVDASKRLKIDKDKLQLAVTAAQDGYLYIALAGSDRESLYLLYPNALDNDNAIRAGSTVKLPRKDWDVVAGGPAGKDTLLIMLADSPRKFEELKGEAVGPFTRTLLDEQGKARLQWLLGRSATASDKECVTPERTRNLKVTRKCSDAFAASLLEIEEFQ